MIGHRLPILEKLTSFPAAVVAGGAGFIGSHLCEKLLSLKIRVICLDNLETGKKENLKNCVLNQNFLFIEQDINKPIKEIPEKIDYIFHLAGLEEDLENKELNIERLLANSLGTKNLLDLALHCRAKFLLGSILDVYFAYLSTRSLEEHFSSFYSLAEAKRYAEALVTEYYKKFNLDSRIVRLAEVFGPRMNLYTGTEMAELFTSILFEREIKVKGDGLKKINPTYILDLVEGLTRAMFKSNTKGKVFNLIGEKISLINLAYLGRKINPGLKIFYVKEKERLEMPVSDKDLLTTAKEIGWRTKELEEAMRETVADFKKNQFIPEGIAKIPTGQDIKGQEITAKKGKGEEKKGISDGLELKPTLKITEQRKEKFWQKYHLPKISPKKRNYLSLLAIILFLLGIFYPLFGLLFSSYTGVKKLREIENKKILQNFENTARVAQSASSNFIDASNKIESFGLIFSALRKEKTEKESLRIFSVLDNLSQAISHLMLSGSNLNNAFTAISGELSDNPLLRINEAKLEIEESKKNLSLTSAGLKDLKNEGVSKIPFLGKKINLDNYQEKIEALKKNLDELESLLTVSPLILGDNQRKTYLVLLQNNMELRPTGGFIGSFGLLVLEDGKLIDFKIEDIYTADGQLKGKVNPPDEILHYLGQPSWYLRDSNFSPDFPLSAERAQWFLEKEIGVLVDGVVAVDLSLAQKLLKAVNGVEITDFKEKITAANLFEKAEYQSEINFFPGSTQKKSFLTALGKSLFEKMLHPKPNEYFEIARALTESLKEKHLLIYSFDGEAQAALSRLNFSGEVLSSPKITAPGVTNDYLMVVDANFGANKANYFVKRKIKHEVNIGKLNEVTEKVTVNYKNNSPTDSWPGGAYKNYLRIVIPQGASFGSVNIGENKQGVFFDSNKKGKLITALTEDEIKKLKPDEFLIIETNDNTGKSWGIYLEVPVGKEKSVSFSYRLSEKLKFLDNTSEYSLSCQKQPGTVNDKYEFVFGYPSYLKVLAKTDLGIEKKQVVSYNTDLSTDREIKIKLSK